MKVWTIKSWSDFLLGLAFAMLAIVSLNDYLRESIECVDDVNLHVVDAMASDVPAIKKVTLPDLLKSNWVVLKTDGVDVANDKKYIRRFAKVAVGEHVKYGIPASISMAQGIVESNAGKSKLAIKTNNHFGIKCFSKKCSDGHCVNFSDDHHKDYFLKFGTAWESWRAHSKVLKKSRYSECYKCDDYTCWAKGLKKSGYATHPRYDKMLIEVIKRYELSKLDEVN